MHNSQYIICTNCFPGYQKKYWAVIDSCKILNFGKNVILLQVPHNIQALPFEIEKRKQKWLFVSLCIPRSLNNKYFFDLLSELLDLHSNICDNKIAFGNFNLETSHLVMLLFMSSENLINLVKGNTCCKGKGSCVDLILTNRRFFKCTFSSGTGLSDHHHLISLTMKTTFAKEESKYLKYRYYKNFNLKELQNCNRKLFLCPPQKQART